MARREHGSCPAHRFVVPGPWDALWGGVLRSNLLKATLLPSDPALAGMLGLTWVGLLLVSVFRWCPTVILTPPGGLPIQGCAVSNCLCRGVQDLGCYGLQCKGLEQGQSVDQALASLPAGTYSTAIQVLASC